MGQKKLIRFAAIKTFPNVLEYPENMPGAWSDFFANSHPITLELACGRGEYTVGLSRLYPERNFIGVDIKGNRMYIGAKKCLDKGLKNGAFLRTQIEQISRYFAPQEVSEIWLTFPDPQLRTAKAKKRLTHPRFLRLYQQFLVPNGIIHLKTDSPQLFQFTHRVIELYQLPIVESVEAVGALTHRPELEIKTHYESLDIAGKNTVHYLSFRVPEKPLPNIDEILQDELRRTEAEETA
jgi:tRNA (guanine-N7-)-methyltransferase